MEREKKEAKTLYHISHLHPLKLTKLHQEGPKPICHACRLPCTDLAFGCSPCGCFLHPSCARLPRTLRHPSHPSHPLTLRLIPAYSSGAFSCSACGGDGIAFCFHCPDCEFDLHLPCALLPEKLNHPSHPSHALTLTYEYPYDEEGATCDLCPNLIPSSQWMYLCRPCDFGGHVDCFTSMKSPGGAGGGSQQPSQADPMAALMESQQRLLMTTLAADHARRCIDGADLSRRVTYVTVPGHSYTNLTSAMLMQQAQQMAMLSLNNSVRGNGGAGSSGTSGGVTGGGGGGDGGNEGCSDA